MEWIIKSRKKHGDIERRFLYWSNFQGWVSKESATVFTEEERKCLNLPIGGEWIPWILKNDNISLSSCKQKIEWLEEVNRELLEACIIAKDAIGWQDNPTPELIDAFNGLKKVISKAEGE